MRPRELLKLRINEISAVDRPANQRRFLVIKRDAAPEAKTTNRWQTVLRSIGKALAWTPDQIALAEHEAESFDDMMARRRIGHVVSALYDHYYALIDTLTSVANSDEAGKPALVRSAIDDYLGSLKDALDDVIADAFSKGEPQDGEPLAKFEKTRKALERLLSVEGTMPPTNTNKQTQTFDLTAIPEAHRAVVKGEVDRLTARIAELEKAQTPAGDPTPEDVLKHADPAVRKILEDQNARIAKAEAEAKQANDSAATERAAREKAERIQKAQTAFGGITVDFTKIGEALHALDGKVDKTVVETIESTLKAASEQIKTGKLFAELGHSAPPAPESAIGKIQKRAEELRKADSKLTPEQAEVQALDEHPELYDAYNAEQASR